jgi:hypothetical protein
MMMMMMMISFMQEGYITVPCNTVGPDVPYLVETECNLDVPYLYLSTFKLAVKAFEDMSRQMAHRHTTNMTKSSATARYMYRT